ncbi:MAG TPA: hypothetical protein EYP87_02320 [Flavobacteriaceae bacterium]|nr:hypothetical protein [Flavobacteriaceae bacterium]
MSTLELRKKWIESIARVDEKFLRMVDALYNSYSLEKEEKMELFEDLPIEIQNILLKSRKSIDEGNYFLHEDIIRESKQKYNI